MVIETNYKYVHDGMSAVDAAGGAIETKAEYD